MHPAFLGVQAWLLLGWPLWNPHSQCIPGRQDLHVLPQSWLCLPLPTHASWAMHVCGHICLVSAAKAICKEPTHRCLKNCLPWYPDARPSFRPHPHLPIIVWGRKAALGRAGLGDPMWSWSPGWSWHPLMGLCVPTSEIRWLKWVTSEAFLPLRCMISSLSSVKWIYYLYSFTHSWQSTSIFGNFSESIALVYIYPMILILCILMNCHKVNTTLQPIPKSRNRALPAF